MNKDFCILVELGLSGSNRWCEIPYFKRCKCLMDFNAVEGRKMLQQKLNKYFKYRFLKIEKSVFRFFHHKISIFEKNFQDEKRSKTYVFNVFKHFKF